MAIADYPRNCEGIVIVFSEAIRELDDVHSGWQITIQPKQMRPVIEGEKMKQLNERQMQVHVPIVAWLLIGWNTIVLLVAMSMFALMMLVSGQVRDPEARMILPIVGAILPTMMGLLTVPDFIAAFGLLARKRWARIFGVVVGILNLPGIPMGTLVGGYTIFVLMQDAATDYFASPPARLQTATYPV